MKENKIGKNKNLNLKSAIATTFFCYIRRFLNLIAPRIKTKYAIANRSKTREADLQST